MASGLCRCPQQVRNFQRRGSDGSCDLRQRPDLGRGGGGRPRRMSRREATLHVIEGAVMGGKAIRRREKNYKAAHDGGNSTRLPPPPDLSTVDALPSKLRKLMSFAGGAKQPMNLGKKNTGDGANKTAESTTKGMKRKRDDLALMALVTEHEYGSPEFNKNGKKKKKKKGKKADDLRFKALDSVVGTGSRRKDRKKKLLEAKKKKLENAQTEEDMDFRGHEQIKFGDVVEAPPKLTSVPKAFKATTAQVASHERLRLQAVEAYRKRKGWESRPGIKLPPPVTT